MEGREIMRELEQMRQEYEPRGSLIMGYDWARSSNV